MRATGLLLLFLVAPLLGAQGDGARRFGEWLYYSVPAEGSEPAIEVVETRQPVRGISVIYSCTRHVEGPEESLLLLNPGFANMKDAQRFDALFTFGKDKRRAYADARLQADPAHGTLDVVHGRDRVLRHMQRFSTFIITQNDSPITTVAIPTAGFDKALKLARARCGV
jgi:hypothetical protein